MLLRNVRTIELKQGPGYRPASQSIGRWMLAVSSLVSWSCGGGGGAGRTTVTLAATQLKPGQEINLRVDHAPKGWSGEVNVNNIRHFPIDAKRHSIRVNSHNGFARSGEADVFVMLLDERGHEIPLANRGRFHIKLLPQAVTVVPDFDLVNPAGGSGSIRVTSAADYNWSSPHNAPWVKLSPPEKGPGADTINYTVDPNSSNEERSTQIDIGDASVEIVQLPSTPVLVQTASTKPVPLTDTSGGTPIRSDLPMAKITLEKTTVKMGQELQIHVDQVPDGWSGELEVNSLRNFRLSSKLYRLKANQKNGFNPVAGNDLFFLLTDLKGRQIPVPNQGHFRVSVTPASVTLDREGRNVAPEGLSSSFTVTAAPGYQWSVSGVPDWVRINSGASGTGKGTVAFTVLENLGNRSRTASLAVGDANFDLAQSRPVLIQIPFHDTFQYSAPPAAIWTLNGQDTTIPDESLPRWTWDEQPGQHTVISIVPEGPTPGENSMLLQKPQDDSRPWGSQIFLPAIKVRVGAEYKVSTWMKAENPGWVTLGFGESRAPYTQCGLTEVVRVKEGWAEYTERFRVNSAKCEGGNNRFAIQAGKIHGKLWIANFQISTVP